MRDMMAREQVWWTAQDVRRLVRYHPALVDAEPWATWLRNRGGVAAIYALLQRCPLAPDERAILTLLLERPGETAAAYARAVAVSRASYFRKLAHLLDALALHLNSCASDQAPPPASVRAPISPSGAATLPLETTSFYGRVREIAEIAALLRQPDVRLLTLTGPGGIGKTRLALRAAATISGDFADGVLYVPLDEIDDPRALATAIARRLDRMGSHTEAASLRLADQLRDCQMLLLLDNFEHLLTAGALLGEVLMAAPHTKILVTSRAVLRLTGACTYMVPPLMVTDPVADRRTGAWADAPAVILFARRAQALRPSFALTEDNATAIAEICWRLDGVPLAIELAAAWGALLSPQALLQRLDRPLSMLIRGALDLPPRQRTLRASLEWSHQLLTPQEQQVFARIGVFAGSWLLDAAEAVCAGNTAATVEGALLPIHTQALAERANLAVPAPDAGTAPEGAYPDASSHVLNSIASLLDMSMLAHAGEGRGEQRFRMLATVRAYACERLRVSGEERCFRDRHARHFLDVAERAGHGLRGPGQALWLARLEQDHDNLRVALDWAGQAPAAPDLDGRLAGALGIFWHMAGHITEGRRWLEGALARCPAGAGTARTHYWAGAFAVQQGDLQQALAHFEESAAAYQAGDEPGSLGWLLLQRGLLAVRHGQTTEAQAHFMRARCSGTWVISAVSPTRSSISADWRRPIKASGARCARRV